MGEACNVDFAIHLDNLEFGRKRDLENLKKFKAFGLVNLVDSVLGAITILVIILI